MRVRAHIAFLSAADGGRSTPIRGGWFRPNHNFGDAEDTSFDIGQVTFDPSGVAYPGESIKAIVDFIVRPGIEAELYPGRSWRIQEGRQLIAIARVVELA